MIAYEKRFEDTVISLDGGTFVGCVFERCTLVYAGLLPVSLEATTINHCKWSFTGPAANTIGFMTALYSTGGDAEKTIERTFDNIRKNATGQRSSGDTVVLN